LNIILVECGIELIPKEIKNHASVENNLKKDNFSSQILDNALHHTAMKRLKNYQKRGRPDILHLCLLNALGSPLNLSGNLNIYFHTVQNKIFHLNPKLKIARNYNRFKGIMAKLLLEGNIRAGDENLISSINGNLKQLLKPTPESEIIICSSKGKLNTDFKELFSQDLSKNYIIMIGGFQKGNLSPEILCLSNKIVSISENPLNAWNVVNKIISLYEIRHDIH